MRRGGDGSGASGDTEGVIAVVQSLSRVCLFVTPWITTCQAYLLMLLFAYLGENKSLGKGILKNQFCIIMK